LRVLSQSPGPRQVRHGLLTLLFLTLGLGALPAARAQTTSEAPDGEPKPQWLPSARPSGDERNDRVWFAFYPPTASATERTPAAILLHHLGVSDNAGMRAYARHLSQRGIAAVVMTLPYHMERSLPGVAPFQRYAAPDARLVAQANRQAASDVSTLADWLQAQPSVDPARIGAVGVSLGAIVLHLAMGLDNRLGAGVAFLGGATSPRSTAAAWPASCCCATATPGPARRISKYSSKATRSPSPRATSRAGC
jgi:dienelactone hydrolase